MWREGLGRRGTVVAVVAIAALASCSPQDDSQARSPGTAEGPRILDLELVPGEWDAEELAAATTPDFAAYMTEELMFEPGDCESKALLHRIDLESGWADGRMDSLRSKRTWYTVWKPVGKDWWTPLGDYRSKYPRCRALRTGGVPVSFYAASLAGGRCKDRELIDYADYEPRG